MTEVFERYKRMTGEVEEAVLEMYLQGVSTRKIAAITVLRPRGEPLTGTLSDSHQKGCGFPDRWAHGGGAFCLEGAIPGACLPLPLPGRELFQGELGRAGGGPGPVGGDWGE